MIKKKRHLLDRWAIKLQPRERSTLAFLESDAAVDCSQVSDVPLKPSNPSLCT